MTRFGKESRGLRELDGTRSMKTSAVSLSTLQKTRDGQGRVGKMVDNRLYKDNRLYSVSVDNGRRSDAVKISLLTKQYRYLLV